MSTQHGTNVPQRNVAVEKSVSTLRRTKRNTMYAAFWPVPTSCCDQAEATRAPGRLDDTPGEPYSGADRPVLPSSVDEEEMRSVQCSQAVECPLLNRRAKPSSLTRLLSLAPPKSNSPRATRFTASRPGVAKPTMILAVIGPYRVASCASTCILLQLVLQDTAFNHMANVPRHAARRRRSPVSG